MPEHAEIRIMSEFINHHADDKVFSKLYHVQKGNQPIDSELLESFKLKAKSNGKELTLNVYNNEKNLNISVFMGMTGSWKLVETANWNETKFIRMRIDREDGYSLILYGLYMGPKYRLNGFTGTKRGPDPVKDFHGFKKNILENISNRVFNKPVAEVILNQQYFNGVGAYLTAEILGRLDINPNTSFNKLSIQERDNLFEMVVRCCNESYKHGGGELISWTNPFSVNSIEEWILFYQNKEECFRQKFGTRNIWIQKKWNTKINKN